jgi:hypothetical protein
MIFMISAVTYVAETRSLSPDIGEQAVRMMQTMKTRREKRGNRCAVPGVVSHVPVSQQVGRLAGFRPS